MTASDDLNLTTTEEAALKELRSRVSKDVNQTKYKDFNQNHLLYRFLKARDWNVDQAEIMMRKWFLWRTQNRIDDIAEEYTPPKVLQEYFKNWLIGYDKEQCPIYYLPFGKWDAKGLAMSAKYSDIEKTAVQISEKDENYMEKTSLKLNRRLSGFNYICDLEGLTFANATDKKGIETFIRLSKLQQDAYPERLKNVYFIKASTLFTFPFNIIKNFMPPKVLCKMHVFGTEGWKEELLKTIDADQLPKFLGGTRTDPDGNPLCKTFLNQGGKIDEKFYMHKTKNSLANYPDVTKLVLSRASFSEIELHISEPGSIIEWDFETKTRDIGFGFFRKDKTEDEEQLTELVPLQRLETSDFFETGMYKCEKAGDYVALFDNSYSWVRSKEIFYRIRIVTPSEMEDQLKQEG